MSAEEMEALALYMRAMKEKVVELREKIEALEARLDGEEA